ncbi:MAG: flagellar biosynthesis protein FliQ [Betaproteobacteria bacterium]|jgi:flagellar biosynthetic protein FliQ
METGLVLDIAVEAITVMVLVAAPVLGAALGTGLLIGILQAATSIQEMTLSFIPKLAVMVLALIVFGEWQLTLMIEYFDVVFDRIRTLTL